MEIKAIGNQYSQYGSTTFFKGLRITVPANASVDCKKEAKSIDDGFEDEKKHETGSIKLDTKTFVIGMNDCIPVRPMSDSPIECLAEVRMIWKDKSEDSFLLSLRLFFLPENTPKGRISHGEDEVVAVKDFESPKGRIVIRAEDFCSWLVEDLQWNWGLTACFYDKPTIKLTSSNGIPANSLLSNSKLDFSEVEKEKEKDGNLHSNVTVVSYSRYYRYRAALKRFEHIEDNQIRVMLIETVSGFVASSPNTRIMFAKETIDYPDLESHEMLCPHLAPKLKGKPRGRRKKFTSRVSGCSTPSSEFSAESGVSNDSDVFDGKHLIKNKDLSKINQRFTRNKRKSESVPEVYTTLSTGRVSKQRLPLTPLKSATNKRKSKAGGSDDDSSSSDDNQEDEDYDDKYVNRKRKQDSGLKRQQSSKEDSNEDGYDNRSNPQSHMLPALQIPLDASKSSEELDFLIRLNAFMAERSLTYPKLVWSLRDVNLFTIYTRVQKLGGFNAIADNRVWKNLFEDLSEPGKCITQGMTKRKYERILLPFERYERNLKENGSSTSELTISTIPKGSASRRDSQSNRGANKQQRAASPAIEIIPLKNGASEHTPSELTMEQINEIQGIIKPKDFKQQYFNGNSNDGLAVPVHVIVRPNANGFTSPDRKRRFENEWAAGSSRSFAGSSGQQKPKEKENIPMMPHSTTIVPLNRDGVPTFSTNVVDLIDSGDEADCSQANGNHQMKRRKLEILREGGLEVTPISRKAQIDSQLNPQRASSQTMQPNVSLMSLAPARAPPVIQSPNMYQPTRQVFKNPREDVINAAKNSKSHCLDLTSKSYSDHQQQATDMSRDNHRKSQLSIEEVQRNYRGSNPDLMITLVKPHQESPSSSSSASAAPVNQKPSGSQRSRQVQNKKTKNVPSQPQLPQLNPALIAAANELQKLQQQNMPLFPFMPGLDITPLHQSSSSGTPKSSSSSPALDVMSYLSALYGNPLLSNPNMSNLAPAVELLKLYSASNRIPSSKN